VDVEPTAEIIDKAASELERAAGELRRKAAAMREKGDIEYASEAISTLVNLWPNLRIDLLVTRPIRALMTNRT